MDKDQTAFIASPSLVIPLNDSSSEIIIRNNTIIDNKTNSPFMLPYDQSKDAAPVYLFCCALSLAAVSSFLRAGFILKFLIMIIFISIQGCVLSFSNLYRQYDSISFSRFVFFNLVIRSYVNQYTMCIHCSEQLIRNCFLILC